MIHVQVFKLVIMHQTESERSTCYVVMWYPPTSTIVILAALHMGWLKFRAVFLIIKKSTCSVLKSVKPTLLTSRADVKCYI